MNEVMRQTEIEFFWPLTEQMPLELDYSNCEIPKLYTDNMITATGSYVFNTGSYTTTQIIGNFSIDADKTTFKTSKKPNIIRKALFSLMGIKLENT
jgi:hypothetical protein